ncbi:MAG: ISL3 family transposase, partial [Actinobacteria bacterium]|nr:ISL3 family transposase [Actinomycetota bacterium]
EGPVVPIDAMTIRLHLRSMRVLEVLEDLPERLVVAVVALSSVIRCGACGHKTARVHATGKVRVRDLPVSGRPMTLVWHRRRFRCGACKATTTETHPLIAERITTRLACQAVRDAQDMTILAVARRHGLSWHAVMRLVAAHGALLARARRRRPCRVLLVDEKSMRKGQGQYSTILVDGDRGRVIAVLKGRSADVLGGFLSKQSPAWRRGVAVVVTDMAECYRSAIRTQLPHARHVADRFHVVRNFAKVLVSARRDAQRSPRGRPHDPSVFGARFLLMKRLDRLSGEEMARLGALFDAHPELGVVWGLVQRFHVIFCAESEEAANEAVGDFTDAYQAAGVNLGSAITTFCRWGTESLNFHAGHATNAAAAGRSRFTQFREEPNDLVSKPIRVDVPSSATGEGACGAGVAVRGLTTMLTMGDVGRRVAHRLASACGAGSVVRVRRSRLTAVTTAHTPNNPARGKRGSRTSVKANVAPARAQAVPPTTASPAALRLPMLPVRAPSTARAAMLSPNDGVTIVSTTRLRLVSGVLSRLAIRSASVAMMRCRNAATAPSEAVAAATTPAT